MAVTAAQAIANHNANPAITQAIADTAANLLAVMTDLLALQAAGGITGVQLIGTANVVSAAGARALAQLHPWSIASGATLIVADGPTALLDGANSAGLLLATAIQLTGTNTVSATIAARLGAIHGLTLASGATLATSGPAVTLLANAANLGIATSVQLTGTTNTLTAAEAAVLAHLPGFALATGATLVITDTAAHLLDPANSAAFPFATRVALTGGGTVSAAQASGLVALHNFRPAGGTKLLVSDTAANLLLAANAPGVAKAVQVTLTGTATVTALQMRALGRMKGFNLASGASVTVSDSADQLLLPSVQAGLKLASAIVMTGSNVENVARAARLSKLPGLTFGSGATLTVRDNATHLVSADGTAAIALATAVVMTGANYVNAAQADMFAALPHFSLATGAKFLLSDTAAALLDSANAPGLALAGKVRLIGTNTLNVADALRLAALKGFHLGAAVPGTLTVQDSAANVVASLDALQTMAAASQITAIALTDSGTPNLALTGTQYTADSAALGLISTPVTYTITLASGASATARTAGVTLIAGTNDTLTGGPGNDTYAFGASWGSETVNGFAASDVLQFSSTVFADWTHLLGASAQSGSDVVITLDATDTITLKNVLLGNLTSANARFV